MFRIINHKLNNNKNYNFKTNKKVIYLIMKQVKKQVKLENQLYNSRLTIIRINKIMRAINFSNNYIKIWAKIGKLEEELQKK